MTKQIKAISGMNLFKHLNEKVQKAVKKFKDNGGMCLNCGLNPGDPQTMKCSDCTEKAEALLKQLRGPGFVELSIPVKK